MQTDHTTDRQTDRPTDRRTLSHIELLSHLKIHMKGGRRMNDPDHTCAKYYMGIRTLISMFFWFSWLCYCTDIKTPFPHNFTILTHPLSLRNYVDSFSIPILIRLSSFYVCPTKRMKLPARKDIYTGQLDPLELLNSFRFLQWRVCVLGCFTTESV